MAQLDDDKGRLVLRIVYDGPAFAGKTSSVRSLGATLGRPVFSSESPSGRTLHFDWLDYEGGRYEGHTLCCQVVTVPGQADLVARRYALLDQADAVVFVVDSRGDQLASARPALESLQGRLAERPAPRPGVLVQANWRDAPEAVTLDKVRDALGLGDTIGITESIATNGAGVRQTFVLAVRLALDRVAQLQQSGTLAQGTPEILEGRALLAALERQESENPVLSKLTPPLVPTSPPPSGPVAGGTSPRLPGDDLPVGRIWPPVDGRLLLLAAAGHQVEPERRPSGDWVAQHQRWFFHSAVNNLHRTEKDARDDFLAWARWHASVAPLLSPRRCLAVVEGPDGTWRLWQTLRAETSLAAAVEIAMSAGDVEGIVRTLLASARSLDECFSGLAAARLPVTLETVGVVEASPVYVGVVPSFQYLQILQRQVPPSTLDFGRLYRPLLERLDFYASPLCNAVVDGLLERANIPAHEKPALSLASVLSVELRAQ